MIILKSTCYNTTTLEKALPNIQQAIFCVLFLLSIDLKAHGDIHQHIDKLTVKIEQTPSVDLLLKRALLFSDESDLVQAWKDIETARSISPPEGRGFICHLGKHKASIK